MTKEEEAIEKLTAHLIHWRQLLRDHICPEEEATATINAFELAIESLKQKSILDRIRAEIRNIEYLSCPQPNVILNDVLQIIDKYKTESEE